MVHRAALLLLPLALAACHRGPSANSIDLMDQELVANATDDVDPAVSSALADQIMVDPKLAQQANAKTIKPAPAPVQAPIPPGEDQPAPPAKGGTPPPVSIAGVQTGNCRDVSSGAEWARRLPAAFPIMPGATVMEAAGSDRNGCTLRIVNFTAPVPIERVLAFYAARAAAAGYTASRDAAGGEIVLGGSRGGAAYTIMARSKGGGTDADLVVNGGL